MSAVSNFLNNLKQFCRVVCIVQSSCCTGGKVSDADAKLAEETASRENETPGVPDEQVAVERNLLAQHFQHRLEAASPGHDGDSASGPIAVPVRWDPSTVQSPGEYRYGAIHVGESTDGQSRLARSAQPARHGGRGVGPADAYGSVGSDSEHHARPKRYRPRQRMRTLTDGTTDSAASSLRATTARDEHRYTWLSRFFAEQPAPA